MGNPPRAWTEGRDELVRTDQSPVDHDSKIERPKLNAIVEEASVAAWMPFDLAFPRSGS